MRREEEDRETLCEMRYKKRLKDESRGVSFCRPDQWDPDRGHQKLGEGLDGGRQAALLASSGVLVEDAAASEAIEDAGGLLEFFSSSGLVASGDELLDGLDGGAITGALGGEAEVVLNGLTDALASLLGVCHLDNSFFKFARWNLDPSGAC